jgi:hypothetical protein
MNARTLQSIEQIQEASSQSALTKSNQQSISKDSAMQNVLSTTIISEISSLRLPDNYSVNIGGIKLPPKPIFGKLSRHRFARVHPSSEFKFPCLVVEVKDGGDTYVVAPQMQPYLGKNVVQKVIRLSVDSTGLPKLIFQPTIDQGGRQNHWHTTLNKAIALAETNWVRVEANMDAGQYDIIISQDDLGDPQWPEQRMDELIQDVFGNNIIASADHPYIRQIQGRI